MKVTVCEMPDSGSEFWRAWDRLVEHVEAQHSDIVLLPEMPAYPWLAASPKFDPDLWRKALDAHEELLHRLPELNQAVVLGTRPVSEGLRRFNRAFARTPDGVVREMHDKYYLPDEEGFYESDWFDRPAPVFHSSRVGNVRIGVLICTELMFTERARQYGREGVHVLAVPRATEAHLRWPIGCQMAAIASGAWVLSSNRGGPDRDRFGGCGMVIGPEGDIIATTSAREPFATVTINTAEAERSKATYPRYVLE
ncbi:MAG: carbon-nitrogen hydrolase family protein [Chloroflexota bacterium]|nr:carbon-nitrogen hydrolase family protein [Chloroflexota bacterium]